MGTHDKVVQCLIWGSANINGTTPFREMTELFLKFCTNKDMEEKNKVLTFAL